MTSLFNPRVGLKSTTAPTGHLNLSAQAISKITEMRMAGHRKPPGDPCDALLEIVQPHL